MINNNNNNEDENTEESVKYSTLFYKYFDLIINNNYNLLIKLYCNNQTNTDFKEMLKKKLEHLKIAMYIEKNTTIGPNQQIFNSTNNNEPHENYYNAVLLNQVFFYFTMTKSLQFLTLKVKNKFPQTYTEQLFKKLNVLNKLYYLKITKSYINYNFVKFLPQYLTYLEIKISMDDRNITTDNNNDNLNDHENFLNFETWFPNLLYLKFHIKNKRNLNLVFEDENDENQIIYDGVITLPRSIKNYYSSGFYIQWPQNIEKFENLLELSIVNNYYLNLDFCFLNFSTILKQNLVHLNLKYNNLNIFQLPQNILELQQLKYLNLKCNGINCKLPPNFFQNLYKLEYLNLSHNNFIHAIPDTVYYCTKLNYLNLSYNSFEGELPDLNYCEQIRYLNLESNNLKGYLFENINKLTQLQYLDVSSNKFASTIHNEFNNFPNLVYLNLAFNDFVNNENYKFVDLKQLYYLNVSYNTMTIDILDKFPLNEMQNLKSLFINDNGFNNRLTNKIRNLYNLNILIIKNNMYEYGFYKNIGYLTNLKILDISYNQFKCKLPDSIGNLKLLENLNLGHNKFFGDLPETLYNLTKIKYLNLSHNNFTGVISENLKFLKNYCMVIKLNQNKFCGNFPNDVIIYFSMLETLYLNDNNFETQIHNNEIFTIKNFNSQNMCGGDFNNCMPLDL